MQDFVLSIAGLTATGKTALALETAKQLINESAWEGTTIISADSRQVYEGLEILSGADVPTSFIERGSGREKHYTHQSLNIQIFGISIISPQEDWSVAHFLEYAQPLISTSLEKNWLPIIMGGTGLYHQQLLEPQDTLGIKPDPQIRDQAQSMTVEQLQDWLKKLAPKKLQKMNRSDSLNPRRLTRAIEISLAPPKKQSLSHPPKKSLTIGLFTNITQLEHNIAKRVEERLENSALKEVKKTLTLDLPRHSPVLSATGVKPLRQLLTQQLPPHEAKKAWILEEMQYAKRQLTWYNKHKPNLWIDVSTTPTDKQVSLIKESLPDPEK